LPLLCQNETAQENEFCHVGRNEWQEMKSNNGPPDNMKRLQARACVYSDAARRRYSYSAAGECSAANS